ncbi:MAG: hypothetical protein RLO18_07260, partial [Gimesia chilikensis]
VGHRPKMSRIINQTHQKPVFVEITHKFHSNPTPNARKKSKESFPNQPIVKLTDPLASCKMRPA